MLRLKFVKNDEVSAWDWEHNLFGVETQKYFEIWGNTIWEDLRSKVDVLRLKIKISKSEPEPNFETPYGKKFSVQEIIMYSCFATNY